MIASIVPCCLTVYIVKVTNVTMAYMKTVNFHKSAKVRHL